MSATPESITEAELADYLELVNGQRDLAEGMARAALDLARRSREPEPVYAVGDLFEDDEGKQWYRVGGDLPWRHVPSSQHHGEGRPKRPLRKLIPEGKLAVSPPRTEGEEVVQPREMYQDNIGQRFYRLSDDTGWLMQPEGIPVDSERPAYPLRRLVPEGSHEAAAVLVAEWRGVGEQNDAVPAWRGGYRAALRKCADELEYALRHGGSDD